MRKVYAPYSQSGENVLQTPLEGYIEIQQEVIPTIETGFVNENGLWIGNVSSDTEFQFYQLDQEIANSATFITAQGFDMTGFNDLTLAIKPTNAGNYAMTAVMGSDGTNRYANLTPLDDAAPLRGSINDGGAPAISNILLDGAESLTANVWNIFLFGDRLRNQKLVQFSITNNSGGISTVETQFLRSV
jgi:hypothetical protein